MEHSEKHKISRTEKNLFLFYHDISTLSGISCGKYEGLNYVMNTAGVWPSFILGQTGSDVTNLPAVSGLIKKGVLPSFWIRNATNDEKFERTALSYGIRKINEWQGMYLERDYQYDMQPPDGNLVFSEIITNNELDSWLKLIGTELITGKKAHPWLFHKLLASKKFRFFCAKKAGKIVSTLLTYSSDKITGIYMVSTRKDLRGKSIGTWITKSAMDILISEGNNIFVLHSTHKGLTVYRKIGFTQVCLFGIYWMLEQV